MRFNRETDKKQKNGAKCTPKVENEDIVPARTTGAPLLPAMLHVARGTLITLGARFVIPPRDYPGRGRHHPRFTFDAG